MEPPPRLARAQRGSATRMQCLHDHPAIPQYPVLVRNHAMDDTMPTGTTFPANRQAISRPSHLSARHRPATGSHIALRAGPGPPARVRGTVKACFTMSTDPGGSGGFGVSAWRCPGVSTCGIRAVQAPGSHPGPPANGAPVLDRRLYLLLRDALFSRASIRFHSPFPRQDDGVWTWTGGRAGAALPRSWPSLIRSGATALSHRAQ